MYKVVPIKCDGYLNVDPGTMSPTEHGEVFVLDDGAEVDMDFGHYERFLGITCKNDWNLTMGKVFSEIREKERRGDYLGKTVQMVPHVSNFIRDHFIKVGEEKSLEMTIDIKKARNLMEHHGLDVMLINSVENNEFHPSLYFARYFLSQARNLRYSDQVFLLENELSITIKP